MNQDFGGRGLGSLSCVELLEQRLVLSAPVISLSAFQDADLPHKLSFRFNQPVKPIVANALSVQNLTTGQPVPAAAFVGSYNATSMTETYVFAGASQGRLPDGMYRATIPASAVTDLSGNPMAADVVYNFSVLPGDANHDGAVDFNDLTKLAQNYNTVGNTYAQGDFNHDGAVDFNDLVLLAQHFNSGTPTTGGGGNAGSTTPTPSNPTPTAAGSHLSDSAAGSKTPTKAPTAGGVHPGIAIDTAFGVNGKVITDLADPGISQEGGSDAQRTPDGKLVVVGTRNDSLCIVRYNPDGSRDDTFGDHGLVLYHLDRYTNGQCVYVQPDGKIVVTADVITYAASQSYSSLLIMRFQADGTIDTSFGTDGSTLVNSGGSRTMAVLSDGKFLVGGHLGTSGVSALWRFDSDGTLDTSFGTNGVLTRDQGRSYQETRVIAPLSGGRALVINAQVLNRINANGSIDTTFGVNGAVAADGASLLPDGNILLFQTIYLGTYNTDILVSRVTADGAPDLTFAAATGGTLQIDFGARDSAYRALAQADGKVLIWGTYDAGTNAPDFALARILPDGTLDDSFGINGHLVDPFDQPDTGYEGLAEVIEMSPGHFVAVGSTTVFGPGDYYQGAGDQNIAIAAYVLDPDIDVHTGGSYGPVPEGSAFSVSAAGTSYATGSIVKYEWDYGYNGVSFVPNAVGQTAQLTAGDDPSAVVGLRVTTSDGLQVIVPTTVTIQNVPPTVNAGHDRFGVPGTPTAISFSATDAVSETITFTIDWGDGTAPTTRQLLGSQVAGIASHAYSAVGLYTVTVTADDGDGGVSSDTTTVRIGDVVANLFYDINGNNALDAGDTPRAGQRVYLDLNLNGQADPGEPTATSNDDGQAFFNDVPDDGYTLRADPLKGYQFSSGTSGATDILVATGSGASVNVGYTQRGSFSGAVFNDLNANGQWDPGEVAGGVGGTIQFAPVGGGSVVSTKIDSYGFYRASGLPAGDYTAFAFVGKVQTFPSSGSGHLIHVAQSGAVLGVDFGYALVSGAAIRGTAFNDANGDGIRQSSEFSLSGRIVYIDANNNGQYDPFENRSLTSDNFMFTGLAPGTYTLRLTPRPGWVQTTPEDGYTLTVTAGQQASLLPFGSHIIDTTPPTVVSASFDRVSGQVTVNFSEPVLDLASNDIRMTLLTPPTTYSYVLVSYDPATSVAIFGPGPNVNLPPGDYQFRLVSGSVTDAAGNLFSPDYTFKFSIPAAAPALGAAQVRKTPTKPVNMAQVFQVTTPIKRATPRRAFAFA